MSSLGIAHLTAALAGLALGGIIVFAHKGTPTHRVIGSGYVLAILVVNVTGLCLYRLTGRFGPFHALALLSLATIARGFLAAVQRRDRWLHTHYYCMAWSYVGLLAAACAESVVRVPALAASISSPSRAIGMGIAIAGLFTLLGALVLPRAQARAFNSRA